MNHEMKHPERVWLNIAKPRPRRDIPGLLAAGWVGFVIGALIVLMAMGG